MNSWQQPVATEPGGATWHKVADPGTGWFASKTAGWTADSFTSGLTVDFSSVVPLGTRAIRIAIYEATVGSTCYTRKGSDSNISNTPNASEEYATIVMANGDGIQQAVIWLSSSYTADFAVTSVDTDLYVSYPLEYLL